MQTVVEYGHYYSYQGVTESSLVGKKVFRCLKNQGYFSGKLHTVLFVDDVHRHNPHEETDTGIVDKDAIVIYQKYFHKVVRESTTKTRALGLIQKFSKDNISIQGEEKYFIDKGVKILLSKGKEPSCTAMDLALTLQKNDLAGGGKIINILPDGYTKQQEYLHECIAGLFRAGYINKIAIETILFGSDLSTLHTRQTILTPNKKGLISLSI